MWLREPLFMSAFFGFLCGSALIMVASCSNVASTSAGLLRERAFGFWSKCGAGEVEQSSGTGVVSGARQ